MRHFGFGRAMAVGVDADGVSFQQEEGVVEFLERGAVADADEGDPGGLNATPSPWRSLCARGPAGFAAPLRSYSSSPIFREPYSRCVSQVPGIAH